MGTQWELSGSSSQLRVFIVPSVCQKYCGSRMEGHSCIKTKVLAEDVSSDGTHGGQDDSILSAKLTRIAPETSSF
jgi:hypothetical protein